MVVDLATLLGVSVALVLAVTVVRGRRLADIAPSSGGADSTVHAPQVWPQLQSGGHPLYRTGGGPTLIEFGDFQCPVCGGCERTHGAVRRALHGRLRVIFYEWPLPCHPLADPAVRAAECAGLQGQFQAYHDLRYERQDSLGLIPFDLFARRAGVRNIAEFHRCDTATKRIPAIEADLARAERVGGPGTPTIVVNGVRLGGLPDSGTLLSRLRRSLPEPARAQSK